MFLGIEKMMRSGQLAGRTEGVCGNECEERVEGEGSHNAADTRRWYGAMQTYDIRGVEVAFPYVAYESQRVYMEKVIQSLQEACFPTTPSSPRGENLLFLMRMMKTAVQCVLLLLLLLSCVFPSTEQECVAREPHGNREDTLSPLCFACVATTVGQRPPGCLRFP